MFGQSFIDVALCYFVFSVSTDHLVVLYRLQSLSTPYFLHTMSPKSPPLPDTFFNGHIQIFSGKMYIAKGGVLSNVSTLALEMG